MQDKSHFSRRTFLKKAALASAGLAIAASFPACKPAESEMLLGSIQDLEKMGSLGGEFNGNLVLARKNKAGQIVIFSLVCSHKRCTVEWKPENKEFHCPCHEGKYDQEGFVLSGPPPSPLRRYKHEVRGTDLWVLNQSA